MRHEGIVLTEIVSLDLPPYFWKEWSRRGILRADAVYLRIPVGIDIVLRLDKPRLGLQHLTITHHTDADLTDGAALTCGGLKVDRNKTSLIHSL